VPPPPVAPKPDVPPPPEKKVESKKPEKKPEKPTEKKPEKPTEKKPEKKPEKPKPKPIVKGKRVGPETQGKKDKTKAATEKAPSKEEIRKSLDAGAVAGNKNQIPPNEASRVKGLIQRVFREKCEDAGIEPCGSAVTLTVTFKRRGAPGAIEKIAIKKTSGNRSYDNRVLSTCRGVRQISGISETFLTSRNYTIEVCVFVGGVAL
jgi:outer membrane biosynthesis protein TonB